MEMVQSQPVRAGDGVVGHPLFAGAVGAGREQPMQHAGEDGAFDRELEQTLGQQRLDHGLAAGVLPQAPEQQRRADALAGELIGIAGGELGQHHGALGVAGDGTCQALELTGGGHGLLAAEVLDDTLLGAAVLAHALDEVEVGIAIDAFFADEHAGLAAESSWIRQA